MSKILWCILTSPTSFLQREVNSLSCFYSRNLSLFMIVYIKFVSIKQTATVIHCHASYGERF